MKLFTCIAVLTFAIASSSVFADEAQQLLRATSDAISGNLDVQLLTNQDLVATAFQAVLPGKTQKLDLTGLAQGIVLLNVQNYDVVKLKSTDFDPAHGGTFQITYLRNALSSDYATLDVDVERVGDHWVLMTNDQGGHQVVTTGFFKANKFFGQIVGIDSITLR